MKVVIDVDSMEELREVLRLLNKQNDEEYLRRYDPTRDCPCKPHMGGSGVCGCVLGGPSIVCGPTPW